MTDLQLYLAIGAPMLFNAVLIGLLMAYVNSKVNGSELRVSARIDSLDRRFDDLRDLWRAELLRVEGVFDARLKHLEEERR